MKKILFITIAGLILLSCKKSKVSEVTDPLEGEWYFRLENTGGFYAYNDRGAAQFNMSTAKSPFKITKATEGKYYISLKQHAGRVMDYSQVNSYTYLELLPQSGNESQMFNFEKVQFLTDVYYIRSVSHPNHFLTGISNGVNYSLFFDVLKPNSTFRQQWKLEK